GGERLGDFVLARLAAAIDRRQRVAPPLQADAAERRLAHHFARLRHFVIEGVERPEIFALARGRKKRRQEAVAVVAPHHAGDRRGALSRGHRDEFLPLAWHEAKRTPFVK